MTTELMTFTSTAAKRRDWRKAVGATLRSLRGLAPLAAILLLWQLLGSATSPYFPVPSQWAVALAGVAASGQLWSAIGLTMISFLIALVASVVIGTIIGILLGASESADAALNSPVQFLRAIPAAAVVPAATLLLGTSDATAVGIVIFTTVWLVIITIRSAMKTLNPLLLEVSATLRLSRPSRVRKLLLPSLVSPVLLAARVTAPIALLITLLVELLTGDRGLGGLLATAQQQFLSSTVYGYVVITAILALAVNAALQGLDRWAHRYAPAGSAR